MSKVINQEHLIALKNFLNNTPYLKLLNIEFLSISYGEAVLEVKLEEKHLNPFGSVHAGVFASAIDTAAYWSVYCNLEEGQGYTSLDVNVSNLSAISSGILKVVGKAIKVGRSICLCEVTVLDSNDKLIAKGSVKLMLLQDGKQSLSEAFTEKTLTKFPNKFNDM